MGNDKVPPEQVRELRILKAVKQGLYLRPARSDWPALWPLSRED